MPLHTRILAAMSDPHSGFRLGLMAPGLTNLAGSPGTLNEVQEYLWELYEECILRTIELAAGHEITLIVNGDICHGDKYPVELVSTALSDQIIIGAANIKPWLQFDNVTTVRIASGTGAHEFGEGSATSLVAEVLSGEFPGRDIKAAEHGLPDIDGKFIDYAHHGPHPGSRVHLTGNTARAYLRDRMLDEIIKGNKPPDLYLCAHFHQYVHEIVELGEGRYRSEIAMTPSLCMLGEYGRQATRSTPYVTNGIIAFSLGESITAHPFMRTLDTRQREKI